MANRSEERALSKQRDRNRTFEVSGKLDEVGLWKSSEEQDVVLPRVVTSFFWDGLVLTFSIG